jgi:nicotinate-nucleotide adenylyltransferase
MSKLPEQALTGVFGGSFDPPHNGHVTLVRELIEKTPLANVIVAPSGNHPLKNQLAVASFEHRLAMARLAFADIPHINVSDIENRRGLSGYTIDTLLALKQEDPARELAFLIGADLLPQFPSWHRPEDILREAILIVGQRPGHSQVTPPDIPSESIRFVKTPLLDISSSNLRSVIRASGINAVDGLVPKQVSNYIAEHRLYL